MSVRPKVESLVAKRSVFIGYRKTSITLERPFWEAVKEIAANEGISFHHLITRIDEDRQHANLWSTIRLFVLGHFRRLASEAAPAEGNHS
jgi:predicted DNA-binding ribbon-helix-helix protein